MSTTPRGAMTIGDIVVALLWRGQLTTPRYRKALRLLATRQRYDAFLRELPKHADVADAARIASEMQPLADRLWVS